MAEINKKDKIFWMITSPDGMLYSETIALTLKESWSIFCYPALNKEAYEKEGWKALKYTFKEVK